MLLFFFVVWVIAELAAMVLVAEWIGVFWMLVLLFAGIPVGIRIIRWQARSAGQRVTARTGIGDTPTLDVIESALGILAGALFVIPGFLSDIVGAILLIGPIRRPVGMLVRRSSRLRWVDRGAVWVGSAGNGFGGRSARRYDAESTAHDINDRQISSEPYEPYEQRPGNDL